MYRTAIAIACRQAYSASVQGGAAHGCGPLQGTCPRKCHTTLSSQDLQHPAVKKFDLSSMRFIASGAAPLSAELTNQLAKLFPAVQIGQGFGATARCSLYSRDLTVCGCCLQV